MTPREERILFFEFREAENAFARAILDGQISGAHAYLSHMRAMLERARAHQMEDRDIGRFRDAIRRASRRIADLEELAS